MVLLITDTLDLLIKASYSITYHKFTISLWDHHLLSHALQNFRNDTGEFDTEVRGIIHVIASRKPCPHINDCLT